MSATAKIRKKQIDTGKIINILVQGEHVAEEIIFQIEGEPSLVSSFSSLNFYLLYTRPGDDVPHILLLDGATLSEGIIYVPFVPTSYFTAVDGTVKIQLMASESSGLTVNQDGTIDGASIWETFPEFLFVASSQLNSTETIIEENVLTKYLSGTREQALKSEGYATGKQNGVAVGSDSPYYHNNSDFYRTLAATSAGNASTSEGNALIYKNQAQGSAEAAQASAESASASAAVIEAHATAIEAIADDLENIDDVAGDLTNINTVSGSINNVDTVAGSISNVNTVAGDKTNVDTVAGAISNVNSVSANIANINAVASNATNINAVNGNKTNIDTVAGKASEITTVAGKASEITTVAGKVSEITTVAGIDSDVTAVAGKATEVGTVAGIASQVATVAGATSTIGTVVTNIEDINDVADDLTKITAVADDLTNIDAVADDLTNIDNAVNYALEAEGFAVGEQNGVPVTSGSPYYQNNAKYYSQEVPALKNALRLESMMIQKGSLVLASSDFEQGTRDASGDIESTTRIRINTLIPITANSVVCFKTESQNIYFGLVDPATQTYITTFDGWYPGDGVLKRIVMPSDGLLNIIVARSNRNLPITPSAYDVDIELRPSQDVLGIIDNAFFCFEQGTFGAGGDIPSTTVVRSQVVVLSGNVRMYANDGYRIAVYTTDYQKADYLICEKYTYLASNTSVRLKITKLSGDTITPAEAIANVSFFYATPFNIKDDRRITKLRVSTYNIGHFSHGESSTPAGTVENLQSFRNAIFNLKTDLAIMVENDNYFDAEHTMPIYDTLYNIYKYYKSGIKHTYDCNALLSRFPIIGNYEILFTEHYATRYFYDCVINIDSKIIHVIATHLDFYDITIRQAQITQLINYCQNFQYVIIAGDFNTSARINGEYPEGIPAGHWEEDYAMFTNAGYIMANTGYFGVYTTLPDSLYLPNPLDNIFIKSSSGTIDYVEMQTPNVSDHYPLIAEITLY